MKLQKTESGLLISELSNFDPFVSCECGQCFRFEKITEREYSLIARNKKLYIIKEEGGWLFRDMEIDEFKADFVSYFDLERDYGGIIKGFSCDATVTKAASICDGIRIFRQDPWETLISFIISQNNRIPRIQKIINSLCELLGEQKDGFYCFPSPEKILNAGISGLAPIKCGFRDKYIIDAAQKVASGEISLDEIAKMGYLPALEELKKIKGVGDKVANCVLLFGFGYYEAFPIDTWMKQIIDKYYPNGLDPKDFGAYAGIAQQYLFHYERNIAENEK